MSVPNLKFKFQLVFLVVCVALAAASPQLLAAWPGYAGVLPGARTVVAGPTVLNDAGARLIAPGLAGFI